MQKWKRMKGMVKATNQCPKCHGEFPDEDYDSETDLCIYCLFPEASKSRPAEISHELGYSTNVTFERQLLDNLDDLPEKQGVLGENYMVRQRKPKALKRVNL